MAPSCPRCPVHAVVPLPAHPAGGRAALACAVAPAGRLCRAPSAFTATTPWAHSHPAQPQLDPLGLCQVFDGILHLHPKLSRSWRAGEVAAFPGRSPRGAHRQGVGRSTGLAMWLALRWGACVGQTI